MKYDDFADADVEGKIILIIRREPQQGDAKSVFAGKKTTTHSYIRTKLQQAKKQKAAGVLFVNDPHTTAEKKKDQLPTSAGFGTSSMGIPFAHLSHETVNKLLETTPVKAGDEELKTVAALEAKINETLQPLTQPLQGWSAEACSIRLKSWGSSAATMLRPQSCSNPAR